MIDSIPGIGHKEKKQKETNTTMRKTPEQTGSILLARSHRQSHRVVRSVFL
jgi:hypothetical protein